MTVRPSEEKSILVADDEPGFRDLFSFVLEPFGYRTVVVADGAEALAQALTRRFDLLLLDEHMPCVNGFDTLAQIRQLLPRLPIVMMGSSSTESAALEARAKELGAIACLFKPVELPELLRAIEMGLSSRP